MWVRGIGAPYTKYSNITNLKHVNSAFQIENIYFYSEVEARGGTSPRRAFTTLGRERGQQWEVLRSPQRGVRTSLWSLKRCLSMEVKDVYCAPAPTTHKNDILEAQGLTRGTVVLVKSICISQIGRSDIYKTS